MKKNDSTRQSQRDHAYRAIRQLLILDKLPLGKRLRETQWARDLGVNRAALREAFARLEAEGLIEKGVRTGYFVPLMDQRDIDEVLQVRAMLESGAVDLICQSSHHSARDLDALRQACDDLEDLIAKNYALGVSEADRRFHDALIDAAGNRRLCMLYHRAPLPMIHRKIIETEQWAEHARISLQDHRQILEALIKGDVDRAKWLVVDHLDKRYLLPLQA